MEPSLVTLQFPYYVIQKMWNEELNWKWIDWINQFRSVQAFNSNSIPIQNLSIQFQFNSCWIELNWLSIPIQFMNWSEPWPWPWIFKIKCIEFAKLGRIAMKRKANINWTLGLKCDHQVWLWAWLWGPWPWIFKVKYGICYSSAKNGPIASKWKA